MVILADFRKIKMDNCNELVHLKEFLKLTNAMSEGVSI